MFVQQNLVRDGSLVLSVDESLRHLAGEWMPSLPESRSETHPEGGSIQIDRLTPHSTFEKGAPSLALGNVTAWVNETRTQAWLETPTQSIVSSIDLETRIAHVGISDASATVADMLSSLTIAAALLLVRDGRTAIHAGAVTDPGTGRAWLLVGDSHTGKSTTTANLVRAGWSYLSDDYVVLSRSGDDGIEVEGWPDDFHLDEGFTRGESTGVRATYREDKLPAGLRVAHAMLQGVLFTRISKYEPTVVTEVPPVFALERLIRQSPWLVADSKSAGRVFDLLRDAASTAAGELRLGLDTFAAPEKLATVITKFAAREP